MLGPGILLALALTGCEESLKQAAAALQQKNLSQARLILDSARSECSASASFFELDGVTDALSNQLNQAEAAFRQALVLDPNSSRLSMELGVLLFKDNKIPEATKNLEKALELDPANQSDAQYLAMAYSAAKRTSDILRLLDKQQLPSPVLFSLGTQFASQERYQEAAYCFAKIPANDADDAVYFDLGMAYSHLKQWAKARESYFKAIDKHPGHTNAYFHVGLDYVSLGEPRRAVPWLLQAHELGGGRTDIDFVLCEQLIGLRYFQSADQALKTALAQNPKQPLLQTASGDLAQAQGDYAGARKAYQKALQQEAQLVPALVGLARCDAAEGHDQAARERLGVVLSLHPNDSSANEQLGILEIRQANWAAALPPLQRASAADSANPNIGLSLARVLRHLGRLDESLRMLKRVEPALPDSAELHLELAQVYSQLHRATEAEAERTVVSRLQPGTNTALRFEDPQTYVY